MAAQNNGGRHFDIGRKVVTIIRTVKLHIDMAANQEYHAECVANPDPAQQRPMVVDVEENAVARAWRDYQRSVRAHAEATAAFDTAMESWVQACNARDRAVDELADLEKMATLSVDLLLRESVAGGVTKLRTEAERAAAYDRAKATYEAVVRTRNRYRTLAEDTEQTVQRVMDNVATARAQMEYNKDVMDDDRTHFLRVARDNPHLGFDAADANRIATVVAHELDMAYSPRYERDDDSSRGSNSMEDSDDEEDGYDMGDADDIGSQAGDTDPHHQPF